MMKRGKFLVKTTAGLAAISVMPLGWLIAKKSSRTTKGIIPYLQKNHNEMMFSSEFGYDEFVEMMEKVFRYSGQSPKMLMCVYCGNVVTIPDNCSCGRAQNVYEKLRKMAE